jgi:cell division protein FtsW
MSVITRDRTAWEARRRHPSAPSRRRLPLSPPPRYFVLWGLVIALTLIGLAMVLSATSFLDATKANTSPWTRFADQGGRAVVGLCVAFVLSRIDVHHWRPFVRIALAVALVLCIVTLITPFGKTINGARAWISFGGPFAGQPSELLKLAMCLHLADLLARRERKLADLHSTLYPSLLMVMMAGGILLAQRDLGTAIVLVAMSLAILFVAGAPLIPVTMSGMVFSAVGLMSVMAKATRRNRFLAFLNPDGTADGPGYQLYQARVGMANGGVFGTGYGQSRAKWGFLPEAHTDFIFAIVAEEFGLIGGLVVIGALAALVALGWRTARRAPDRFSMLLAAGITSWIAIQTSINLGAALGVMPITGLPLPFLSFGGSSLMVLLASSGLLLSIARRSNV